MTKPIIPATSKRFSPISIPQDKRGILTGRTGTGKTTLAIELIHDKPRLLVVDPKHHFEIGRESIVINDVEKIGATAKRQWADDRQRMKPVLIYRPSIDAQEDLVELDRAYAWAIQTRNVYVYNDELMLVTKSAMTYPSQLKAIYVTGRALGVGTLGATQRPSGIPLFCISECEYFWKFDLSLERDNDRMSEFMVPRSIYTDQREYRAAIQRLSQHTQEYSFWFKTLLNQNPPKIYVLDKTDHEEHEVNNGKLRAP